MSKTEIVSITFRGTSAELELLVQELMHCRDAHGWCMNQTWGANSQVHRLKWEAISQLLANSMSAIQVLGIAPLGLSQMVPVESDK